MTNKIGAVLAKYRSEKDLSQRELALLLKERGVEVTNQAVSKWENGTTQPGAAQFIALCQILEIKDVVGAFCGNNTGGILDGLNRRGRELALEYIALLKLSNKYRAEEDGVIHLRRLPLYDIAASAGTGQLLDSDNYELVEVESSVPNTAEFGVRLSGDSMEPDYHNGDVVWIAPKKVLNSGETGVFLWDGNVYCKVLEKSGDALRLISINGKYAPIDIHGESEFRIFGKVVGKWSMEK